MRFELKYHFIVQMIVAYDFAYSKEKDFMNRPIHDRVSMFIFSGSAGVLSSEGFSGKFNKTESFSTSGGLPSVRDKTRSLVIGSVFNSFGAYMGGRSKGSMETYYNGRSQRNKSALILMKSFADALYYWK